jgi:hypothetical protein
LEQNYHQAQARLYSTDLQASGLGDGNGPAQAAASGAEASRLASNKTDGALRDRSRFRLDAMVGEHRQRSRFGLKRVSGNRGEGAFGSVE